MNHVLALMMENDTPEAFAADVAEAYFANPDHVRRILTEDCIESCVEKYMDNQQVVANLSDLSDETTPFFSKPSRQKGKRKHGKKEVRRKGSTKRFRDRSRKCASEGHTVHVYHRGMAGDWGVRGRRLEEAGAVSTTNSHKIVRDIAVDQAPEEKTETRTFTYLDDGFTLSMSMSKSAWEKEEEDDFSPSFNWDRKYTLGWVDDDDDWLDDDDWVNWEDDWDNDDDEIIGVDCTQEQDTAKFSAIEMADIVNQIAYATSDECVKIREFFKNL